MERNNFIAICTIADLVISWQMKSLEPKPSPILPLRKDILVNELLLVLKNHQDPFLPVVAAMEGFGPGLSTPSA